MEDIKIGDWVVDRTGDYCQVVKIKHYEEDDSELNSAFIKWIDEHHPELFKQFSEHIATPATHELDDIYGKWISKHDPSVSARGFISCEREDIVGVYPTEEVAQIHASVQSDTYEEKLR